MQLSDSMITALIGATATFVSAMFQLYVNARRQAAERKAGKPASSKSGTWLSIFALMLAAAVGGYAAAEYKNSREREADALIGQDAGGVKFVDALYERPQADAKEVCQRFIDWDSQKARQARILVKYTL